MCTFILTFISGIARSTYYYYLKQKDVDKYEDLKQEIIEIFNQHKGRYGYRRILAILKSKGYTINHKIVQKLMNTLGLKGKQLRNGKYHSYKGDEFGWQGWTPRPLKLNSAYFCGKIFARAYARINIKEVNTMTNYREILRLSSLGLNKSQIAQSIGCSELQ